MTVLSTDLSCKEKKTAESFKCSIAMLPSITTWSLGPLKAFKSSGVNDATLYNLDFSWHQKGKIQNRKS